MWPPNCSRQMDLNYKYYFPELLLRAFNCGRSAARTSRMGHSPCLRGTLGVGANSSAVRCHSRTLQKEGQSTSKLSGFYQLLEKKIPAPLEDASYHLSLRTLLWGRTQLGKLEPALSCSRGRWPRGLTGTEGGGPRPSATCQIEGQRQLDVKLGTIVPNGPSRQKDLLPEVGWELNLQFLHHSQPCGFSGSTVWTTDVTFSSLCSKKCTQHVRIIQFLFLALLLWEFWISFIFNN